MRHKRSGSNFNRTANQRKALLRGLVGSLILKERIETTLTKAKEARIMAERLITLGIKGDLNSRRVALAGLPSKPVVAKLFTEIAPRLKGRNGGYLRIVQTRNRMGDNAPMAVIEFVDYESRRQEAAKEAGEKKQKGKKKGEEGGKIESKKQKAKPSVEEEKKEGQ